MRAAVHCNLHAWLFCQSQMNRTQIEPFGWPQSSRIARKMGSRRPAVDGGEPSARPRNTVGVFAASLLGKTSKASHEERVGSGRRGPWSAIRPTVRVI